MDTGCCWALNSRPSVARSVWAVYKQQSEQMEGKMSDMKVLKKRPPSAKKESPIDFASIINWWNNTKHKNYINGQLKIIPQPLEDSQHEFLIHLSNVIDKYRLEDSKFSTWACRVAHNWAISKKRKFHTYKNGGSFLHVTEIGDKGTSIYEAIIGDHEDFLEKKELNAWARKAFLSLKPVYQTSLAYWLLGFKGKEAEEILNINGNAYRSHIFKAIRYMRKYILENCPELMEKK